MSPSYSKGFGRHVAAVLLLCIWQTGLARGQEGETYAETGGDGCHEEERMFDSEVRVAKLKFEEVQTQLLVVCFILIVVLAKMGRWASRNGLCSITHLVYLCRKLQV